MTQNNAYINSKVLIGEIYSDYNIQSDDFIQRFPNLCVECIGDLNFYQAYVDAETDSLEFDNGIIPIPFGFKGIRDVIINNKKADLLMSGCFRKARESSNPNFVVAKTTPVLDQDRHLINKDDRTVVNDQEIIKDYPNYYIDNNYIHTNIRFGTYQLRYRCLPSIYDHEEDMTFPLIYDVPTLRKAIKLYVIKAILIRGYKHPVLSLKENNKYSNPGLEYDELRYRAKSDCNKFSQDRRDNLTRILTQLQ